MGRGRPAARLGDMTAHGTPLFPGSGSVNVLIGDRPAWRVSRDFHICPATSHKGPDIGGTVHEGSQTVFINGLAACRQGDTVEEMPGLTLGQHNVIRSGCQTVLIGDQGGAGRRQGRTMMSACLTGLPFVSAHCDEGGDGV